MQIKCEFCGSPIKTSHKIKRRGELTHPSTYKMLRCPECGRNNFIRIQKNFN